MLASQGDLSTTDPSQSATGAAASQPLRVVTVGDSEVTILGTAHVSKVSAEAVADHLASGEYDAVAIELDENRFKALTEPNRWAQLDLFQVIRQGKAGVVIASLALSAFQQRLADQLGIEPGAEMKTAVQAANAANIPVVLIDRDIGVTLKRVYRSVPWWQRLTLVGGILASMVSRESISEQEIEKLKEGDVLEATFAEFAEDHRGLYGPLIGERDRYMAARIREELARKPVSRMLAVVGAGHLRGLAEHLEAQPGEAPGSVRAELEHVDQGWSWWRLVPWLIVVLIVAGFVIGFQRSPELGLRLVTDWVLINGTLAAIGTLIAKAHPFTVAGTFLAAPLTSLNPTIGAGFVAAGLELWLRKPRVGDFTSLRRDVTELKGWWRNRVARTLLVFLFATLGSAAGTYLAGGLIFTRLFA